jgi:hypothetical protein
MTPERIEGSKPQGKPGDIDNGEERIPRHQPNGKLKVVQQHRVLFERVVPNSFPRPATLLSLKITEFELEPAFPVCPFGTFGCFSTKQWVFI